MPDEPLDAATVAAIERLALELADRREFADHAARVAWVIDTLVERGQLTERHRAIAARIHAQRELRVYLERPGPDEPACIDIDCASLIPLCQARCCGFNIALTADEVRAGHVPWDLETPYVLARDPDSGRCVKLAEGGGCGCYDVRPHTCRTYDCRRDPRVWIDYDARIPAPLPWGLVPLRTRGKLGT